MCDCAKPGQADAKMCKTWVKKCRMVLRLKVSEDRKITSKEKDDDRQDGRRLQERTTGQTVGPKRNNERAQDEENARQTVQKDLDVLKEEMKSLNMGSGCEDNTSNDPFSRCKSVQQFGYG